MSQTKAQLLDGKSATIQYTAGSASAPAISFTSDTNTGIYSPGADQVAISTGGSGRLFVDASGRVGVGTSSPTRAFDVAGGVHIGTGTNDAVIGYDEFSAGVFGLGTASTVPLVLGTTSLERLRITSAGLVGIGTSSPQTQLHINGGYDGSVTNRLTFSTTFDGNANSGSGIYFKNYYNNARITAFSNPASGQGGTLQLQTYNSDVSLNTGIVLDNAGRVGISTTSPGAPLHVVAGTNARGIRISAVQNNSAAYLTFNDDLQNETAFIGNETRTGTAGQLVFGANGSERARIDSSGRLLVGTSSARTNFFNGVTAAAVQIEGSLAANRSLSVFGNTGDAFSAGILILGASRGTSAGSNTIVQNGDELGIIAFQGTDGTEPVEAARIGAFVDGTPGANDMPGRLVFSTTADGQSSPSQALIIESGQQSLFTTSTNARSTTGWYGVQVDPTVGAINVSRNGSNVMAFFHTSNASGVSGSPVGTISITTTATAYNTSSDYRLKENVTPVTDGITRLQQLKPSRFNFIADPAKTVDGFIAHEVQAIVPEAITGEKDAVDDQGNPIYQGIDQSKLVPLLTAALQEAIGEIESLKARLTAAGI